MATRDDAVRLSQYYGGWQLRPAPAGGTTVLLETNMDLQVSLPRSMLRSGAIDELPEVMTAVCHLVAAGVRCPLAASEPVRVSSAGSSALPR